MSDFAYICDYYGVPAKRGAVIEYEGKRGVVTGTHGPSVKAKLDGDNHAKCFHPSDLKWLGEVGK